MVSPFKSRSREVFAVIRYGGNVTENSGLTGKSEEDGLGY